MAQQDKTNVVAEIRLTEHNSLSGSWYGHCEVRVHRAVPDAAYDKDPWTALHEYVSDIAGFQISAYYGNPTCRGGEVYGMQYGYTTTDLVDEAHAEQYARGLKKIGKAYRAHCAKNGAPKSFGQQVIYLLRALGITVAYVRMPEGRPGGMHRNWRGLRTPTDIMDHIDHTIRAFWETHRPDAAHDAA